MATARERLEQLRALDAQQSNPQAITQQASGRGRLEELRSLELNQVQVGATDVDLQDLLIRQSKGAQGLQPQITALRTQLNQPEQPALQAGGLQPQTSPFPVERGESRAALELPELGTGGLLGGQDKLKIAAISPVLLATTDNQELANIITENFPDVGQQFSPAGELILANNKTGAKVIVNRPGLSRLDLLQGLGIAAAFTPAGRVSAIPAALTGKAVAGAAGAALTQTAIEGIQSQVGGELDATEIALAGVLGGAAELVVPAIQAVRQARQAKQIGVEAAELPAAQAQVRQGKEAATQLEEVTGREVGLFPAQQTQQPSELLKQRLLPQLDAGSKRAAQALETQNKQVFDATADLVNTIAPAEVTATGASRFRTASQKALDSGKQRRSEAVKPLFNQAIKEGAKVDLKPVRSIIDEALLDAPPGGDLAKTMRKISNLIRSPVKGGVPSLRQLQKAKFQLDDMIEKFGEGALGNTVKRDVVELKQALVKQMEEASPLFKEAQEKFIELSPAVKELEDSILGQISKVEDVNLKNIAQRIFDPKEGLTNPTVIKNAKKIIDQVDPGAWDDLMRVELNRRVGALEQLVEDLPGELVGNVPGQLRRAIFGNPSQRNALLAGMTKDQRKNFVYLDEVLRRASTGRAAGSPTTPFKETLERLRGVSAVIVESIFSPLKKAGEGGGRLFFDRNVRRLTEVMFDTKFEPQLTKLRKLDPNSPAAARALAQLLKVEGEENE